MMQHELSDPEASVRLFPWSPNVPVVVRTARMMHVVNEEAATEIWREALRQVAGPLMAAGVPLLTVRDFALDFREAVSVVLDGLAGPEGDPGTPQAVPGRAQSAKGVQ